MAKQSILTDAKETVVEAGKTAAEGVKNVATDALVAGAAAAAGVVAERVSQGLRATENKVQRALPTRQEAAGAAERAIKPQARRKAAAKGRRAAAKKAATSRKAPATAKKRAATPSKKKAAARKAAATRKAGTRKAGRKSAKRRTR
jgi:hypothetical protein